MADGTIGTDHVERLVIRAPNWLGDAVMALPAMAAVRAANPGVHVAVAAVPAIAPLFAEPTSAAQDSVVVLQDPQAEIAALRAGGFGAAILLPNSFRSAWSAYRAAIPNRWGYRASGRRLLLTRALRRPRGRVHQSAYYLSLVEALGFAGTGTPPRVAVSPSTSSRAMALLAAHGVDAGDVCVGFAPGAAYGHAKRWPPRMVAEAIGCLVRERRVTCVMFGAADDRESGREIESSLPSGVAVVNLIGRTDLRVLVGAISRCAAFVSNDSGAMHLAAALGVPVAAVFGPTDERVTAPIGGVGASGAVVTPDVLTHRVFCRPCMLRDCPIDHRCMKGVTVHAVVAAVSRRLDEASRGERPQAAGEVGA
jgi:heptosyltransferase-2